jgi:acyl-CoA thioester hydrolase
MSVTAQPQPTVDCGHLEPMAVHFDDLDSMGIVHNSRYAVMLERVLNLFWTRQGYTFTNGVYSHPDVFVAVAEFSISYRMPVRGTGEIFIHFWVERFGDTSVMYAFRVLSADGATVHAEGRRVHIRLDPKTLRPTSWQDDTRAVYETMVAK